MPSSREPLFLDHCSTTPPLAEVLAEHARVASLHWGNPSSPHATGRAAARELERARTTLAQSLGARPAEIVLCSSGTEANNLALQGLIHRGLRERTGPLRAVVGADSHASVLEPLRLLQRQYPDRLEVVPLPILASGHYDYGALTQVANSDTILLSLLHINNETGVVQDLGPAAQWRLNQARLTLHVDWVQSHGKWPLDLRLEAVDVLTASAHKIHGMRGAALLYLRAGTELEPLIVGGAQEKFRRAGTVDVAAAAAYAKAISLVPEPIRAWDHLHQLERALLTELDTHGVQYRIHGPQSREDRPELPERLPGILNLAFPAMPNREDLLIALDLEGISASATSACHSGIAADSHVLKAMGLDAAERACSIRLAFSCHQTLEQARQAGEILARVLARATQS